MNTQTINALKVARKIYSKVFLRDNSAAFNYSAGTIHGQDAADLIRQKLLSPEPLMIARFGAVELTCLANYLSVKQHKNKYAGFIRGTVNPFWWDRSTMMMMAGNAGFFPSVPANLERFARLMLADMKQLDVLASWQSKESLFNDRLQDVKKIGLLDLEPYNHAEPWSEALEGKRVLVIHPFEHSIKSQYKKRHLLFPDARILPQFELKTIKAIQSIANNETPFKNWFEALDHMKEQIMATEFDVAIIGCGAYGFPLAAHVKRMGRKAIHLGGATQILFGIRGRRWESQQEHRRVGGMMNEYWSKPLPSETPAGNKKIEDGCYW